MKKLELTAPYDFKLSPFSGWSRAHWDEAVFRLMEGIVSSASEHGARQRIPGPRSHHGLLADELEGFTRSFFMAGPWLTHSNDGKLKRDGSEIDIAGYYYKGILAGTDPKHPEYWGDIVDYAQHLVEMAALSWGLYQSKNLVWDKFSAKEKQQVADYMFQCTKVKYHQNNWLLFNVITNSVLKKLDMPYSQQQIDENLQACDHMYVGDGWYRDGNINRIDYYNAWAFLFYYLIWTILDGDSKPDIAEMHKERVRLFARDFRYFFSNDGSTPCFGRSMIYRFGYLSPLALGQYLGCLDIPAGEVKTMCNMGMKFFFDHEILTANNHLSMGFLRPSAEILEHYSCGGSPYWAAKAFNILMIKPDDPFWIEKEAELPVHKESFSIPLQSPGFVMLGDKRSGHIQLINQKSYHDKPEYNAKYTKFAYSSVFSYEARMIYKNFNCDNILQFSEDGINFRQRWEMENLYCEKDFNASKYPLYEIDPKGTGYTSILVKDDFMINFHLIEPKKSLIYREGGYPLGFDEGKPELFSTDTIRMARIDGKLTFMQNLYGYNKTYETASFADDINGSNVRYRSSVVPSFGYENPKRRKVYLASMVCGRVGNDTLEQMAGLVKSFKRIGNTALISFYDDEKAFLQIGKIEQVSISLNGREFAGDIVVARVGADGKKVFVLFRDGNTASVNYD